MRWLLWFVRLVLFLILFSFAVKNDQLVALKFFFGTSWQTPLVFVILVAFAAGALLGVTSTVASLVRKQREIGRLRRQVSSQARNKAAQPVADGDAPESF